MTTSDDLASAGLTAKELLREVYTDMKFVRPALEGLLAANIVSRVVVLEQDKLARDTRSTDSQRTFGAWRAVLVVGFALIGTIATVANVVAALLHH